MADGIDWLPEDPFDDFDARDIRFFFHSFRPDARLRGGAAETLKEIAGNLLVSMEFLQDDRPELARAFVVSYGQLLRVRPSLIQSSSMLTTVFNEASLLWEKQGTSLARLAIRNFEPEPFVDIFLRRTDRQSISPRTAARLLEELDCMELLHWASDESKERLRLRRSLERLIETYCQRSTLFVPAASEAKRIALVVGDGRAIAHDELLVGSVAKYKILLLNAACTATGEQRFEYARLARKLPPHGEVWQRIKARVR